MPDMRDVITKSLQSWCDKAFPAELGTQYCDPIKALAPAMADHLVENLPLVQQWAVGVEIDGKLDEVDLDTETEVRDDAMRELAGMQEELKGWKAREVQTPEEEKMSYALYTTFGIDWIADPEPDIEEDLARLVLNDEDDDGAAEPEYNWQPTGFKPA
jgi:hypothetical protein